MAENRLQSSALNLLGTTADLLSRPPPRFGPNSSAAQYGNAQKENKPFSRAPSLQERPSRTAESFERQMKNLQNSPTKPTIFPGNTLDMPKVNSATQNDTSSSFARQLENLKKAGHQRTSSFASTASVTSSPSRRSKPEVYPLVHPCQGYKASVRGMTEEDYLRTTTSFARQMEMLKKQQDEAKHAAEVAAAKKGKAPEVVMEEVEEEL